MRVVWDLSYFHHWWSFLLRRDAMPMPMPMLIPMVKLWAMAVLTPGKERFSTEKLIQKNISAQPLIFSSRLPFHQWQLPTSKQIWFRPHVRTDYGMEKLTWQKLLPKNVSTWIYWLFCVTHGWNPVIAVFYQIKMSRNMGALRHALLTFFVSYTIGYREHWISIPQVAVVC